jgi:oligopeptide/dipeptide ABC transporter ATP-binding protein
MTLTLDQLSVTFPTLTAVEQVSFDVPLGGAVGLVGESGSGKSVSVLAAMRLLPTARVSGRVLFEGRDVYALAEPQVRALRGAELAMVFQDPMASLNPVMRIGDQVAEPLVLHKGLSWSAARAKAVELLERVGVPAARDRARAYPFELSGGLRQRAVIAMALACEPKLLIADEPTTALDVTVQAQVMELLAREQQTRHMALLLVSHDLSLVGEVCDRVVVMYAGQVVERGEAQRVLKRPRHPYTRGLLDSSPALGSTKLKEIPGVLPDLRTPPKGCRFADRCGLAQERCRTEAPAFENDLRCHFPLEGGTT